MGTAWTGVPNALLSAALFGASTPPGLAVLPHSYEGMLVKGGKPRSSPFVPDLPVIGHRRARCGGRPSDHADIGTNRATACCCAATHDTGDNKP
jgi:hypothetical protein